MSKTLSRLLAAMTCAASLSVYAADDADPKRSNSRSFTLPQNTFDAGQESSEQAISIFAESEHQTSPRTPTRELK